MDAKYSPTGHEWIHPEFGTAIMEAYLVLDPSHFHRNYWKTWNGITTILRTEELVQACALRLKPLCRTTNGGLSPLQLRHLPPCLDLRSCLYYRWYNVWLHTSDCIPSIAHIARGRPKSRACVSGSNLLCVRSRSKNFDFVHQTFPSFRGCGLGTRLGMYVQYRSCYQKSYAIGRRYHVVWLARAAHVQSEEVGTGWNRTSRDPQAA